ARLAASASRKIAGGIVAAHSLSVVTGVGWGTGSGAVTGVRATCGSGTVGGASIGDATVKGGRTMPCGLGRIPGSPVSATRAGGTSCPFGLGRSVPPSAVSASCHGGNVTGAGTGFCTAGVVGGGGRG